MPGLGLDQITFRESNGLKEIRDKSPKRPRASEDLRIAEGNNTLPSSSSGMRSSPLIPGLEVEPWPEVDLPWRLGSPGGRAWPTGRPWLEVELA